MWDRADDHREDALLGGFPDQLLSALVGVLATPPPADRIFNFVNGHRMLLDMLAVPVVSDDPLDLHVGPHAPNRSIVGFRAGSDFHVSAHTTFGRRGTYGGTAWEVTVPALRELSAALRLGRSRVISDDNNQD